MNTGTHRVPDRIGRRVLGLAPLLEAVAWFPGAALGFGVLCATAWAAQRSPAPVPAPGTHVASTA